MADVFTTPEGRLIEGTPWKGETTNRQGKPLLRADGTQYTKWFVGLAVPKTAPGVQQIVDAIQSAAREAWPKLFANGKPSRFSYKFVDGDSTETDENGMRWCDKKGYAGNYVFKFSSTLEAPTVLKAVNGRYVAVTNPDEFKRGYYCQIAGSIKGSNGSTDRPGVYLNYYGPSAILFTRVGEEIVSGPSAEQLFGNAATSQPQPTKFTSNGSTYIGVQPSGPGPVQTAATAPATAAAAPPPPPAMDFVNPTEKRYTVNGVNYTAEQLKSQGWSDAQIATLATA